MPLPIITSPHRKHGDGISVACESRPGLRQSPACGRPNQESALGCQHPQQRPSQELHYIPSGESCTAAVWHIVKITSLPPGVHCVHVYCRTSSQTPYGYAALYSSHDETHSLSLRQPAMLIPSPLLPRAFGCMAE